MKVLVVGSGAREHALAWKIAGSKALDALFVAPGNAGTNAIAENVPVGAEDVDGLLRVALERCVDLVVIGPEAPLAAGLADALRAEGIAVFGPSREAARLESSKAFAKAFMARHGIPTARHEVHESAEAALAALRGWAEPPVVKADGLAAGKGVVVAEDHAAAEEAIASLMVARSLGEAGATIVLEERLRGPEISFHVVTDGERYLPFTAAQDHKRLLEGDRGPNTGGMGAYSPPPMVDATLEAKIIREVVEPTLRGMAAEGRPVVGALFVGLMLVEGEPKVLEYNVRFGDPETETMMVRLEGDLLALLAGAARGDLGEAEVRFGSGAAMTVVLASEGYPASGPRGLPIEGLGAAGAIEGAVVFHAGTRLDDEGQVLTAGGRVLAVSAAGASLAEAAERAYAAADRVRFDGVQLRRDIGWQALKGRGV